MFISSEFSKTLSVRAGVSSNVIRSPTRSHSSEATDRCRTVELKRTSLPQTYQTLAGILFTLVGIFFRTFSSAKLRSVTPILRQPTKIKRNRASETIVKTLFIKESFAYLKTVDWMKWSWLRTVTQWPVDAQRKRTSAKGLRVPNATQPCSSVKVPRSRGYLPIDALFLWLAG